MGNRKNQKFINNWEEGSVIMQNLEEGGNSLVCAQNFSGILIWYLSIWISSESNVSLMYGTLVLELENATLSTMSLFLYWTVILHCSKRAKNKC